MSIFGVPLMILGTQWYVLFNVIAGVSSTPKNLRYVMSSSNVSGWLKWRRFVLPSIFPYLVTGAITATGALGILLLLLKLFSGARINWWLVV